MPFYLLVVGDPEQISFRFQYQLDVQYAVGRIHFETVEEYARYAAPRSSRPRRQPRSWGPRESGQAPGVHAPEPVPFSRRATFFGVRNAGDRATQLSADHLVKPLADKVAAELPGWHVQTVVKDEATKTRLSRLLGRAETPSLLFSASHGMGFPTAMCGNWTIKRCRARTPGPRWRGPIPHGFYFAGDDLASELRLPGLIAFFFACYGAGTPRLDNFAHQTPGERAQIAPSRIPGPPAPTAADRRVLAVVGYVEWAWGCSLVWQCAGEQLAVFDRSVMGLMNGEPIGLALEACNERYADLSSDLTSKLEEIKYGKEPNDLELAGMWTANNDARSYVAALIGRVRRGCLRQDVIQGIRHKQLLAGDANVPASVRIDLRGAPPTKLRWPQTVVEVRTLSRSPGDR